MEDPGTSSKFDAVSSDSGHQAISEVERQKISVEMVELDESKVEQGKSKGTTEITDLTFDCLEKVFNFVPLKDQLTCVEVWPEWRGNVLLSLKQLKITRNNHVKGVDDLSEEMVFGEKGFGFDKILNNMCNLEVLDVWGVSHKYKKKIIQDIGREKRKLRVMNLGQCGRVNYEAFKSMVDAVPQLEEFRDFFDESKNTDDNVRYLLIRAEHLHTIEVCAERLTSDALRGVRARLKVLRFGSDGRLSSKDVIDHILESSRDTLEELGLEDIPYRSLNTVSKFKNLRLVVYVCGPKNCLRPLDGPTEVFHLSNLHHLQKIDIKGCFHDEDIRGISGSWKDMRNLRLCYKGDASHQPSYDALMCVRYMTSIEKMEVSNLNKLDDYHMEVFSREMMKLKVLKLRGTSVTAKGLKHLTNLPNIEEIECCRGVKIFDNDEEKEEVIRYLNALQREKGREYRIVRASHDYFHLRVPIPGRTSQTSSEYSSDSSSDY